MLYDLGLESSSPSGSRFLIPTYNIVPKNRPEALSALGAGYIKQAFAAKVVSNLHHLGQPLKLSSSIHTACPSTVVVPQQFPAGSRETAKRLIRSRYRRIYGNHNVPHFLAR